MKRQRKDREAQNTDKELTVDRRKFLQTGGTATAAALTSPLWLTNTARAAGGGVNRDILVNMFLRGGVDGITAVVPYGDAAYYSKRKKLAVPPPSSGDPQRAIDLDGFFGITQPWAPLMNPWQNGHLAFIHAIGSKDNTLSHFEAEKLMEYGVNRLLGAPRVGWMSRHLQRVDPFPGAVSRAMAMNFTMPYAMHGEPTAITMPRPDLFHFPGNPAYSEDIKNAVQAMYTAAEGPIADAALKTIDMFDVVSGIDFDNYVPANGAVYPTTPPGTQFAWIAAMVKAGVEVETFNIDFGLWDTHANQGHFDEGYMWHLLDRSARALEAFYLDMLGYPITTVGITEFGRRTDENSSAGTDHGRASMGFVMGENVNGTKVYGTWPGLGQGNLEVTTDYRHVLAEIADKRLGNPKADKLFPGFTPTYLGILR